MQDNRQALVGYFRTYREASMNTPNTNRIAFFLVAALLGFQVLPGYVTAAQQEPDCTVIHNTEFSSYFPEIVEKAPELGPKTPLERPVAITSEPFKHRKATLQRSDGSKVPYEEAIGVITVESRLEKKEQYLLLRRFRNIEMRWLNDRLLLIDINIGHTTSVDAIFDAESGRWLDRHAETYQCAPPAPGVKGR